MEYKFRTKFSIGETVFLAVAGSESYLVSNIYFDVSLKKITYELMNSSGFRDTYLATEITSERMIEV